MTHKICTAALVVGLGLTGAASHAQLRLPGGGIGGLGGLPDLTRPLRNDGPLRQRLDQTLAPLDLAGLRQRLGDDLLRGHPRELARDPAGQLIVRQQLLALPSSAAARERLLALDGVALIEDTTLDGLDLHWLLLRVDTGLLPGIRALDPEGQYDYQHVYLGSGETGAPSPAASTAPPPKSTSARVGLIDSGVDEQPLALRKVQRHGCDGLSRPAAHGTAVASLLMRALPGGALYAADAFCDAPDGGSVQAIAQSLAWLAREQVGVINISLVGPPNQLLQRAVAAAQAKGHLIVAAVGNDGPAAPPLYPAAWPGVVAVTGVDARRRVLAEAGRGAHVGFAAPGSEMSAAALGRAGEVPVRGTSFAAPLVAGLLAAQLPQPDLSAAATAVARLQKQAIDLGVPGRDDIYGWGLLGEPLRSPR